MRKQFSRFVAAAIIPIACVGVAKAQSDLYPPLGGSSVFLEVFKPNFHDIEGVKFLTSAQFVSARLKAGPIATLIFELPFAHYSESATSFTSDYRESGVGNPYLGAELSSASGVVGGEFGVRLAAASDTKFGANVTGFLSDIGRVGAFIPDYMTVQAGLISNYSAPSSPVMFRNEGRLVGLMGVGDNSDADNVWLAHLTTQLWYRGTGATVGGGFIYDIELSDEQFYGDDKSALQFGAAVSLKCGIAHPGAAFRVPLTDNLSDLVDFVGGVNLAIDLL